MLDDIVQIVIEIVSFVVWFFCYLTGEILLFLLTLGRHRPAWNPDSRQGDRPWKSQLLFDTSAWLGAGFWLALILAINYLRT
jgi:hypothetical protein